MKMSLDIIEQKNEQIMRLTSLLDKLFTVSEEFRQNLKDIQKSCECVKTLKNKLNFYKLEVNYKTLIKEYHQNKSDISEKRTLNSDSVESNGNQTTADPNTTKVWICCGYESCDYKTSTQRNMKSHIRRMHLNKSQTKCTECQFQCWGSARLEKHYNRDHPLFIRPYTQTSDESHSLCPMTDVSEDSFNDNSHTNGDNFVFGSNLLNSFSHQKESLEYETHSSESIIDESNAEYIAIKSESELISDEEMNESNERSVTQQLASDSNKKSNRKITHLKRTTNNIEFPKMRNNQKISNELRKLIVNKLNSGLRVKEVSEMFEVKRSTVSSLYSIYKKTNIIDKRKGGHRRPKLTDQQKEELCDWVDSNCTIFLKDLKSKLLAKYPEIETISLTTIADALKNFHFTIRSGTPVSECRNTPEVIEQRYEYAIQYNQMLAEKEKIYFIDKFGVQIDSRRRYGLSKKGTRAHKTVPMIRARNYTVCAAISENSVVMYEIENKTYDSEDYSVLTQLLTHLSDNNIIDAFIIMDKKRFDKTEQVNNMVTSQGHTPVFLPPLSPFMNPIEKLFSQWKEEVRNKELTNEDQLYVAIHKSSEEITGQNCANNVRHMESYLHRCLNREVIES